LSQGNLDGKHDGMVQVAYLHPEEVSHSWVESMRRMWAFDRELPGGPRIAAEPLNMRCTVGMISHVRNYATRLFLDKTDHEWLLFIDTDMGFERDAVHRLLEVAHPQDRPVVGALCFALMEAQYDGMGGHRFTIVPTMYQLGIEQTTGKASFCFYGDYPTDTVVQLGATGAAFLLIHRDLLVELRVRYGDHWWDQMYSEIGDLVGEDIGFCARVLAHGATVHVHTGVQTSHHKRMWLTEVDYARQLGPQQGPDDANSIEMRRLQAVNAHLTARLAQAMQREMPTCEACGQQYPAVDQVPGSQRCPSCRHDEMIEPEVAR
jgi:hypothetical protein